MLLTKSLLLLCTAVTFAAGANVIQGTAGNDDIDGTAGDDVIHGFAGFDQLRGDAGDDIIHGGPGPDFLFGDVGNDELHGGVGDDALRGVEGDDVMFGGAGDDEIDLWTSSTIQVFPLPVPAGADHDIGRGGSGDDTFRWASGATSSTTFPVPFGYAVVSGDSLADGGAGYDSLFVGVGAFAGNSTDYVLEAATVSGYEHQLRALVSGSTVNLRGIEEIEFFDTTVSL